jgi:hypothetical protein
MNTDHQFFSPANHYHGSETEHHLEAGAPNGRATARPKRLAIIIISGTSSRQTILKGQLKRKSASKL